MSNEEPSKTDEGQSRLTVGLVGWQPIETAPKDKMMLLYRPTAHEWGMVTLGKWEEDKYAKKPNPFWAMWHKIGGITEARAWKPTHWMQLPTPTNE